MACVPALVARAAGADILVQVERGEPLSLRHPRPSEARAKDPCL